MHWFRRTVGADEFPGRASRGAFEHPKRPWGPPKRRGWGRSGGRRLRAGLPSGAKNHSVTGEVFFIRWGALGIHQIRARGAFVHAGPGRADQVKASEGRWADFTSGGNGRIIYDRVGDRRAGARGPCFFGATGRWDGDGLLSGTFFLWRLAG